MRVILRGSWKKLVSPSFLISFRRKLRCESRPLPEIEYVAKTVEPIEKLPRVSPCKSKFPSIVLSVILPGNGMREMKFFFESFTEANFTDWKFRYRFGERRLLVQFDRSIRSMSNKFNWKLLFPRACNFGLVTEQRRVAVSSEDWSYARSLTENVHLSLTRRESGIKWKRCLSADPRSCTDNF